MLCHPYALKEVKMESQVYKFLSFLLSISVAVGHEVTAMKIRMDCTNMTNYTHLSRRDDGRDTSTWPIDKNKKEKCYGLSVSFSF